MNLTIIAGVHSSLTTSSGDIRAGRDKVASATMNKEAYSGAVRWTGAYPGLELGYSWEYAPDMNEGQSGPQVKVLCTLYMQIICHPEALVLGLFMAHGT